MDWEITIKKADNGFICEHTLETSDEGSPILTKTVFEDKEINEDDHDYDNIVNLLYFVLEYFGVNYSKHNKKNIQIKVEERKE